MKVETIEMLDIVAPGESVCRLRTCRIKDLQLHDDRSPREEAS
jgi:hypothetical protein